MIFVWNKSIVIDPFRFSFHQFFYGYFFLCFFKFECSIFSSCPVLFYISCFLLLFLKDLFIKEQFISEISANLPYKHMSKQIYTGVLFLCTNIPHNFCSIFLFFRFVFILRFFFCEIYDVKAWEKKRENKIATYQLMFVFDAEPIWIATRREKKNLKENEKSATRTDICFDKSTYEWKKNKFRDIYSPSSENPTCIKKDTIHFIFFCFFTVFVSFLLPFFHCKRFIRIRSEYTLIFISNFTIHTYVLRTNTYRVMSILFIRRSKNMAKK